MNKGIVVEKDNILGNGDVYVFPDADGMKIRENGDFNVLKYAGTAEEIIIYIFKAHRWDNGGFGDGTQNCHSLFK